MNQKKITCIICPSNCPITIQYDGEKILNIEGYQCKKGMTYAQNEFFDPKRTLTSTIRALGYITPVISVKTSEPIKKELLFPCMEEIKKIEVTGPFEIGRVVVENIMNSGADLVLTNCKCQCT